jgi:Tol biopolymer transport system component/C-terminal processing protease CtpA/Prc
MRLWILFAALLFVPLFGQTDRRTPLSEPGISPDGTEVAFVSGGDIWTVGSAGGTARLLVSHPATESRPVYSPDGTRLAFTSTRTGNGDVYVLHLPTGDLKRLTFSEAAERVDSWSADGKYLYFSTTATDISGMADIQRVAVEGGTPMVYSGDRYAAEYFAAAHPTDPGTIALTAKGVVFAQWWRNGHSHIDESEIWIRHDGAQPKYDRLSKGGSKEAWPMWSADGRQLFYMSDASGSENLWSRAAVSGSTAKQLTQFRDGRVLWPAIARNGKTIVFERDFAIWTLDVSSNRAAPLKIALRGTPATPGVQRTQLTTGFNALALSPDGKKIAFVARGDVFAAGAKEGGAATRLTSTAALEDEVAWAPDNKRVVYTSDRENAIRLYIYDLSRNAETRLTSTGDNDTSPVWSPDGKSIAFLRGGTKLMVIDVESKAERELAKTYARQAPLNGTHDIAWSPDNKWIAYGHRGLRLFWNVNVIPAAGGTPVQTSYLANVDGGGIVWSGDGKYILFESGQRTEPNKVGRVDLIPRTPRFREDQFRDLFKEPNKPQQPAQPAPAGKSDPAPAPPAVAAADSTDVKVVAEGIRRRLTILPTGIDAQDLTVSPDGKTLLITGSAAGQMNLWTYSLDELSREPAVARQLTSTPGRKSAAQFSPDGKEVYYLESGRIQVIPIDSRTARPVSVTAETDVDFARDKGEVFWQTWSYLNLHFYDEKFHGIDWKAARAKYEPWVEGSQTPDELRRVAGMMIGDLNASHTGISGPPPPAAATGHLGVRFDRAEAESKGALRVSELIHLGPAEVAGIKVGEYITAVDGGAVTRTFSLPEALEYKANRRVTLTVATDAAGANAREVAVSPIGNAQEKALLYRHWVEAARDYVHKVSNGRLGYVHMADMSESSLDRLYMDLDTENVGRDGVVVDIRNNNGGFVNVYALDVLSRRPFLNMTPRGASTVPARSFLGQRSLERPTVLVTNQHSLSDAEDFTEGYRSMKLGKVVGEPTAGWIIYTTGVELLDGSVLRLPGIKITDANGRNMELNPRPVDVPVLRSIGESYSGRDTQLDAAVRELLKQIDGTKTSTARSTTGGGVQ